MNKIIVRSVLMLLVPFAFLASGTGCFAQENYKTIEIGQLSVTHVLFTSDLTYVNLASPNVIRAKVVESSKNMLALQAVDEFPFRTTISALEANGTMHTFYVVYKETPASLLIDTRVQAQGQSASVNTQIRPDWEQPAQRPAQQPSSSQGASQRQGQSSQGAATSQQQRQSQQRGSAQPQQRPTAPGRQQPQGRQGSQPQQRGGGVNVTSTETSNFGRGNAPTIEEVMRKGRNLYHITDKCFGIEADCINIYAYSDQLYIVLSLSNRSDIGYDAGDAQFTIETRKVTAKTLQSDKPVWPKSSYGKLACAPNSMTKIGYTIPKMTLQKNEVLKVYIYEKDGTRNLFLTLDAKDINYAVSPLKKD